MIKVIIELQYDKKEGMTAEDYKNQAFHDLYDLDDRIDLSHAKIIDTEKDFLR